MAFSSILALFGTMFVLAIIPGPSVFAVVARSMTSGFMHGVITAMGIVVGDFIFILLALLGLWTLAETDAFFWVKYLGSAYLIYAGITTLRANVKRPTIEGVEELSWLSNFTCGLLITLSDPKAILFYAGFLPAYLDVPHLSLTTASIIVLSATIAVGSAKIAYAYLADKARFLLRSERTQAIINGVAGCVLIGTGILLAIKA